MCKQNHILYITTQFPAPSETFACTDVRVLKRLGVDIEVFTQKPAHRDFDIMVSDRNLDNIPITCCGIKELFLGLLGCFRYMTLFLQTIYWIVKNDFNKPLQFLKCLALVPSSFYIYKNIKKKHPDVVHLYWGHYPSIVGYIIKISLPQIKVSMFLGAYDLEMRLGISSSLAKISDFIFTQTNANVDSIKELGVCSKLIHVAYRGVDLSYFEIFSEIKFKKNNTFLAAGRLIQEKGFEKVIDVFDIVSRSNSNAHLSISGDGNFRKSLEKYRNTKGLQDKIKFYGHVKQHELFQLMQKSEFFIFLSHKIGERLPNVIKEAMFAKCVCISSSTPGIEELIVHGETGFIVSDNDVHETAEIINKISDSEIKKISNNAHDFIKNRFNAEKLMQEYIRKWGQ